MSRYKYALHPGEMVSKNDGDVHFISARKLASLYRVNIVDCVICSDDHSIYGSHNKDLVHLYPRYDGNYQLPPTPSTDQKAIEK